MSAAANEDRMLPNEIIHEIFSHYSLISNDRDDGFHRGPDRAAENLSLKLLSLGRTIFFYARAKLFEYIHVGSRQRAANLAHALTMSLTTRDANGQLLQLDGYLKQLVCGLRIEVREPGPQDWAGITPTDIKLLGNALPGLTILDIDLSDKGAWLDPPLIAAFSRFSDVEQLELEGSSGVGFQNARHVFQAFEHLESLKLKSVSPGWTVNNDRKIIQASQRLDAIPAPPNFGKLLTTLSLWNCQLVPTEFNFLLAAIDPAVLKSLTIHQLQLKLPNVPAYPYPLVAAQLLPFTPTLHSLHLILFDRAPILNNIQRQQLLKNGALKDGHLTAGPNAVPSPALVDSLAPSFSPALHSLTIGGPFSITPAFFSSLPAIDLTRLQLWTCANLDRGFADGLTPHEFMAALDLEWASHLQSVRIKGMAEETTSGASAWDWDAVNNIAEKLDTVGQGRQGIRFEHDVDAPAERIFKRDEEYERKKSSGGHAHGGMSKRQTRGANRVAKRK